MIAAPRRPAIYCRISEDREGAGLGVDRQADDCRALTAARGWPEPVLYVDNDISAFQRRKPRPQYQSLLADLRSGAVDAVVVWHLDRLYRQPRELEDLIDLCEHGRVTFAACSGEYDLSTADGRFMARMMVNVANKSSADASRRQLRKMTEVAQNGRPHGGRRPFGYADDRVTVVPHEAAAIRRAVEHLLAGGSLRGACIDLNDHGDLTPRGSRWQPSVLSRMLLRPRLAGRREHNGAEVPAVWAPIITAEEQTRLRAILRDPRRRQVGRPARYLLAGLLRCGACDTRMHTHSPSRRPVGRPNRRSYICPPRPRGCGCVCVVADRLEEWVSGVLLELLDEHTLEAPPPMADAPDPTTVILEARMALEAIAAAQRSYDAIGMSEWQAARAPHEARITAATRQLADQAARGPLPASGERLRDLWPALTTEARRGALGAVVDHVIVNRATHGRTFTPERLTVVWRS